MASHSIETEIAAIVGDRDRDHWLTVALAPADKRPALTALYAYHVEVAKTRDAVTDPITGQIRLQWWRETVEGAAQGSPREHPVAEALAAGLASGQLDAGTLTALADAREDDLDHEAFASEADFLAYLEATAGMLHRAALGALGETGPAAMKAADHVSYAYGITGQMRSCAVNAARGHVLLPLDLLETHGVTIAALRAGRPEAGLRDVARVLADRSGAELTAARALRREAGRGALPILALARLTDAYLKRLRTADYDLFSGRLEPPPVTAPLTVLRTMLSGRY